MSLPIVQTLNQIFAFWAKSTNARSDEPGIRCAVMTHHSPHPQVRNVDPYFLDSRYLPNEILLLLLQIEVERESVWANPTVLLTLNANDVLVLKEFKAVLSKDCER